MMRHQLGAAIHGGTFDRTVSSETFDPTHPTRVTSQPLATQQGTGVPMIAILAIAGLGVWWFFRRMRAKP